jgi:hypothetical protein
MFAHLKLTKKLGDVPIEIIWCCSLTYKGDTSLHCITFGAPPTYNSQSITDSLPNSVFLAFALAGDPFARIDKLYLDMLLQIYCSPTILHDIQISSLKLFNAGTVVILTDLNKDAEENQITALVPRERLPEILFWNVQFHPMIQYLTLVDEWTWSITEIPGQRPPRLNDHFFSESGTEPLYYLPPNKSTTPWPIQLKTERCRCN